MQSRTLLLPFAASLLIPGTVRAQAANGGDDYAICYRFAFGAWTPRLDLRAAGHDPDATRTPEAPGGRSWAMDDKGADDNPADRGLVLFPPWWPVGVRIRFEGLPPALGDTVNGTAVAFVANANVKSPTAPVRAWGVRCGEPARVERAPSANPR